jgi:hypothetical protein
MSARETAVGLKGPSDPATLSIRALEYARCSGKDARKRNRTQHARIWRGRLHHSEDEEPLEADSKMRFSSADDRIFATGVRFTRGV